MSDVSEEEFLRRYREIMREHRERFYSDKAKDRINRPYAYNDEIKKAHLDGINLTVDNSVNII